MTSFDFKVDPKSGSIASRLCRIEALPMFCSYSKFIDKDFILSAKIGIIRDDSTVSVYKKDNFHCLSTALYVPPDPAQYVTDNLAANPLPPSFMKLIGKNPEHLDLKAEVTLRKDGLHHSST